MKRVALHSTILMLCLFATSEASAQFDREWKIFVIPFSHVDVGFTAPVPTVIRQQSTYIDSAIAFVERTENYPEKSRFKWSTEVTWPLEDYLETRSPDQIERLMGHVRAGSIEINAMHFSLQTDLCGPEELVRSLYFAREIEREYDVTVKTAVTNDTPGFTWSLAQILEKAEIPYLSLAMNSFLSSFYETTDLPNLFRWRGQSGDETLVWRSIHPKWAYLEGSFVWRVYSSYQQMETRLTSLLHQLAAEEYPYDFVLINAATGDNGAPKIAISDNATVWNSVHTDSEIRVATFTEFFEHAEASGQDIPVFSGDAPNWWTWSFAASSTGGYLRSRDAQIILPAAEAAASIAFANRASNSYPAASLRRAYINNLLFEDHNLGTAQNTPPGTTNFWERKMGWVNAARDTATAIMNASLDALTSTIFSLDDLSIVVYNLTPWERSDIATVRLTEIGVGGSDGLRIVDVELGLTVPHQTLESGEVAFLARDVPPFGFRRYWIDSHGDKSQLVPLSGAVLENEYYRVSVDLAKGGITSLFDKRRDIELTNGNGRFAQFVLNGSHYPNTTVASTDSGVVLQQITLEGGAPGSSAYKTQIVLPAHEPRVEVRSIWDKDETVGYESVDFVFDMALQESTLDYEIPFGHVRVFEDELSGFETRHYGSQRWSEVTNPDVTVVIASTGASIQAQSSGSFSGNVRLLTSFNNANTAYRAGVGELEARFAISTRDPGSNPMASTQFAYGFNMPLQTRVISGRQDGSIKTPVYSFVRFYGGDVFVSTLKRADDGDGFIIRLFNPSAEDLDITAHFGSELLSAIETTLLEENRSTIAKDLDEVSISLEPFEIKTLRVDLGTVSSIETDPEVASGSMLIEGVYPNPVGQSATIRYRVSTQSQIEIEVFDVLGRSVGKVSERSVGPGVYEDVWIIKNDVAAGVYLIAVEAIEPNGRINRETSTITVAR